MREIIFGALQKRREEIFPRTGPQRVLKIKMTREKKLYDYGIVIALIGV